MRFRLARPFACSRSSTRAGRRPPCTSPVSSRLKDLRAPGSDIRAEQLVGAREPTLAELLHPPRSPQLLKGEASEVDGGEIGGVERVVGVRVGAHRLPALQAPAPGVPVAELVADHEYDRS